AGTGFGDQYLVSVETTQVPWQEGSAVNNPRWMRLMVSDRRAELIPGLPYGDGRGPETPYLLGEIEDMLIINEFYPFIELSPDLEVGGFEIEPVFEGLPNPLLQNRQLEPGQRLYRASFDLVNRGADADEDLSLTVDFGDIAPNVTQYLLIPDISGEFKEWVRPCPAHGVCELPIGQLKENERIRGTFTFFMAEVEDEVVVDLSVNSPNDQNTGNNRRSFVFGPTFVSAPVIETVELSGNVLAGIDAIISGESTPNAELTLFLNSRAGDSFELTTPVNALGGWSAIFEDLDVGNYAVRASASLDGTTGPQSFPTRFTVSDDVGIDTLTVTDIDGNIMPVLQDPVCRGSLIFTCNYFPAGNYLLSARLTHADQQVQIGISGGEFGQLATLEDEDGDGIYTTELIVPEPISRSTSQTGLSLTLSMLANGSESAVTVDVTVADELGQVTDAETDAGIPGATIAISEIEPFIFNGELVDGLSMVHEGILTDADGSYAALVEPGSFQIVVTADSYQPMRQEMIIEQNGLLTLDLELAPDLSEAVSQTYLVTDRGGASTLLIEPGEVIDFINGGSGTLQLVGADWQSGLLLVGEGHQRAFETLGTYNLADGDGQLLVRVIVQDEEPLPPAEDAFFIFMPFIQED
ncbi:MAG: carboxypeptidase regulatory-like domain-containing protein, partial [Chloroflexota bacterium]